MRHDVLVQSDSANVRQAEVPGIDMQPDRQLEFAASLESFVAEQPFGDGAGKQTRYTDRGQECFAVTCAIGLYAVIRACQPRRIIEVGCGYSSGAILDTNERFFGNGIDCHFIDPDTKRLEGRLRDGDRDHCTIHACPVQAVDKDLLLSLQAGDLLVTDGSHAMRSGNDTHYLLFEIFPQLAPGVCIHFHDMFYPFDYPNQQVALAHDWTEAYVLRAFLQYNDTFEILYYPTYLQSTGRTQGLSCPGGSSIWLRKRR